VSDRTSCVIRKTKYSEDYLGFQSYVATALEKVQNIFKKV